MTELGVGLEQGCPTCGPWAASSVEVRFNELMWDPGLPYSQLPPPTLLLMLQWPGSLKQGNRGPGEPTAHPTAARREELGSCCMVAIAGVGGTKEPMWQAPPAQKLDSPGLKEPQDLLSLVLSKYCPLCNRWLRPTTMQVHKYSD